MVFQRFTLALLLATCNAGDAVILAPRRSQVSARPRVSMASRSAQVLTAGDHTAHSAGNDVALMRAHAVAVASMETFEEQTLGAMVTSLLEGKGPGREDLFRAGVSKMSAADALKRLDGQLPEEVAALVHKATEKKQKKDKSKSQGEFSEESLAKARGILNGMVESSQDELDAKLIECKEFESRNRGTFDQVRTDLSRLGEQIADLERLRTEANQGIATKVAEIDDDTALLEEETEEYHRIKLQDEAEMTVRQNDLAVVQFILEITKCPDTLIQEGTAGFLQSRDTAAPAKFCSTEQGYEMNLADSKLQAKFQKMLTPNARAMFHKTIAQMMKDGRVKPGLIEQSHTVAVGDDPDFAEDPDDELAPMALVNIKSQLHRQLPNSSLPAVIVQPTPVQESPSPSQWKKCTDGTPNCGLLHDTMSLQWGKFKDLVDELQMEMDQKDSEFGELKQNMNQQIEMLGGAKGVFNQMLGESISNINADTAETAEKEEQERDLTKEYDSTMGSCKAKIEEILFTNICAVRKVRNTVMTYSEVSPPDQIEDCDISDWVPGACSVPCDDTCPQDDPYACGGFQTLIREVLVSPNEFGIRCPALQMQRKCQQVRCPIDCMMSEWSGFSKCTKDCEGGVEGRTRAVLTKPMNGGKSCDTVQEERACNTGSCDRDCTLEDWTTWEPCSMACSGGLQSRVKNVLIPIRGMGKCPTRKSADRLEDQICNAQDCIGDEICVAQQDLIIAIDSSGSLRESGSDVLRDFAAVFAQRLTGRYYGDEAMKVGIVQFGNGAIEADGTVAKAINVQPLTSDIGTVQSAIESLTWQKGFTNMAQALTLADTMLQQGGRPYAQSAIMMLTDSKPSFQFQTFQKVKALKDKGTKMFFAPVIEGEGKELALMKKWASSPWETHLVHIPGITPLKADPTVFVEKCIATFCPKAISPMSAAMEEDSKGFLLLKMSGSCGERGAELGTEITTPTDCKALAENAGVMAFSFGKGQFRQGHCVAESLPVTEASITDWKANRIDPACPSGEWRDDEMFDFYVIEPTVDLLQKKAHIHKSSVH